LHRDCPLSPLSPTWPSACGAIGKWRSL
jgi:hypothetical protein